MRQDSSSADSRVVLATTTPLGEAGVGHGDATVTLPAVPTLEAGRALPRARARLASDRRAGRIALGALLLGALIVTAFATAHPNTLVPTSNRSFPLWEAGPLHYIDKALPNDWRALQIGFSVIVVAMLIAYLVVLQSVRTLSMRTIAIFVLAAHAILLLSPPGQLTDLFNYLGYARLGGLHHLNPYTHVIAEEIHDPVFRFTTWHHLHSPYGPLFTALTYPLALMSLPAAYWTLKTITVLLSLAFIALVWYCARRLGRDPRFAVLFVAANPIFLMYAIPAFHNDFFMLVPSTAAVALLLARRDRSAGAILMLAVAVKFTAILLLPFLLIGVRLPQRRRRILEGAAVGAIPLIAMSLALFGFSIPNLQDQSTLLTPFSIPNLTGLVIGVGGGAPGLLRLGTVALVVAVALLIRHRGDWLSGAGWATFALIASLAWLVPWYVVWLLPLAALGSSLRLRRMALWLTVFLVIAFIPATGMVLYPAGLNPLGTPVGYASQALQKKLEQ
ncbi:MAG: DUF2029 domain-containing protein [Solirubrobacterales bacterium]|nr:DUF2029 domain-containing protein [Solirubrobacterales bacterium]